MATIFSTTHTEPSTATTVEGSVKPYVLVPRAGLEPATPAFSVIGPPIQGCAVQFLHGFLKFITGANSPFLCEAVRHRAQVGLHFGYSAPSLRAPHLDASAMHTCIVGVKGGQQ